jgi:putative ABC transport system permease protein
MLKLALKMLIGNKASCIGVIFGIFLATLLISQQSAIFLGLVSRSYRLVTDIPSPNIWIIDPSTESDMKVRQMPEGYLDIVKGIPNVEWAVAVNVVELPLATNSGLFDICLLYGIDDASLIGAPIEMTEGYVEDLRRDGAVIVDMYSARSSLAKTLPDGTIEPLKVGDSFEINGHRAVVVGLCKITQGFYPQPVIYTTLDQFDHFTSYTKSKINFIAAKTRPGKNIGEILKKINSYSVLNGLTREEFQWRIAKSFLKTGILINFGLSVALGIIIGFSIAGQIFYMMTMQNLKYYALIKSIGGNQKMISMMVMMQAAVVGVVGYLLGTGVTLLWGMAVEDTTLAFLFPWQLLVFTAFIVLIICMFIVGLSLRKIFEIDPKVLMGN